MKREKTDKICLDCGKIIYNVDILCKYCEECKRNRKLAIAHKYKKNKRIEGFEILKKEYENNFNMISTKIENLVPYCFNQKSNKKVKAYCQFYECTWIGVLKIYNKYNEFYEYIKKLYLDYFDNTNIRDIHKFAKTNNLTYDLMMQFDIAEFMNDCKVQKLRYNDEEYKINFDNIKNILGRVPLFNEFKELTKININSYAFKFNLKTKVYDQIVKMFTDEQEFNYYLIERKSHKTKVGEITGALSVTLTFDDLENEFRRVFDNFYNEYEIYPSRRLFNKFSKHDDSVYRNRFNLSWTDICKQYGYIVKSKNVSETYVLKSISEILNLKYEAQKKWDWLIGVGGKNMFCDGYFKDIDLVVEFDGVQHRIPISKYGGEEKLKRTQQNDSLKNELLKQHNIKLIRIDSRSNWMNKNYLKEILIKNNIILPTAS
jgi:hypothetical protein